jgi:hypothetical protein
MVHQYAQNFQSGTEITRWYRSIDSLYRAISQLRRFGWNYFKIYPDTGDGLVAMTYWVDKTAKSGEIIFDGWLIMKATLASRRLH